jgi:pimeloyl-ACP methyl ester carboxylesterase
MVLTLVDVLELPGVRHAAGVSRVLIVPGAGVRGYVEPAADAVRGRGVDVELLRAPGLAGGPADLRRYGEALADRLRAGPLVDLLVGLSVGAQAAAVAAAGAGGRVAHLVLVSPTVDPAVRTVHGLLARWLAAGRREPARLLLDQVPDWQRAGVRSLARVVRSGLAVHIEDEALGDVGRLTVVHAEHDAITSHTYAAALAAAHSGRLLVVPEAAHSWPYRDADRFAETVGKLLG